MLSVYKGTVDCIKAQSVLTWSTSFPCLPWSLRHLHWLRQPSAQCDPLEHRLFRLRRQQHRRPGRRSEDCLDPWVLRDALNTLAPRIIYVRGHIDLTQMFTGSPGVAIHRESQENFGGSPSKPTRFAWRFFCILLALHFCVSTKEVVKQMNVRLARVLDCDEWLCHRGDAYRVSEQGSKLHTERASVIKLFEV